jgi:hypothetical protein
MISLLLCAQLAVSVGLGDSVYSSPALRAVVARAAAENLRPPPELRSYRSHIETELSLLIRDTLGREHTAQIEQLATNAQWSRDGRYDLHVVGYRSESVGVPYSALTIVRGWTVPSLYGDRLQLGAYFNASSRRRDSLVAVHPFAPDRDTYYRFTGGDTVTVLHVGARSIPIQRIHVHPAFSGPTALAAFEGEIDLDADRAQIVRMRGQLVTLGGKKPSVGSRILRFTTGVVAVAYAEFVNAEVDGRYWLPAFQRTEFQAGFALLGQQRPVFRLVSNIGDIVVTDSAKAEGDSVKPTRVIVSWAPTDSVSRFGSWEHGLGTQSAAVHADDFADLAPDVWRTTGAPRLNFFPNTTERILRFNRVEGAFTGVAPSVDLRDVAPGVSVGANVGWAWTEQTARGGAFVSYADGATTYSLRAERSLATTVDFEPALSQDPGFGALFGSVDVYDYLDRRTALVSATHVLHSVDVGLVTLQGGVASDRSEPARLTHGPLGRRAFRPNPAVQDGRYALASADLELHPDVTGDFVRPGIGFVAHYEVGSGQLNWQRAEVGLSGRYYLGPVSFAAHADAGATLGSNPPRQRIFELGGTETLPGYSVDEFAGDYATLFRSFASYRFNLWKRPIRLPRNIFVPGVSPGLAVSAQGGWTGFSSSAHEAANTIGVASKTVRATVGAGITLFADALHLGFARPVDQPATWRFVGGFGATF